MRRLVVLLGVLFVLALVADFGARAAAESQIEKTAKREAPEATSDASIPVFPFLPPLLFAGKVDEVSVQLAHVAAGPAFFDSLDFDLHGVEISRHALLHDRRIEIVAIERGTVSGEVPLPVLARQLPVAGLSARVVGRAIVVRGPGGVSVSVPLPRSSLIPCDGTAQVGAGVLRFSCTLHDVPPALVEAINDAAP